MTINSRRLLIAWAVVSIPAILILAFWHITTRNEPRQPSLKSETSRAWTETMIDSLARGAEVPAPPPLAAGRDSVWYAMLARNAFAAERFWYNEARAARTRSTTLLATPDSLTLRRQGLADPAAAIRADLVRHPNLIPYKSSEGGFQFFPEEAVLLPGGCWVCAYFEDGLTGGYLLLKYDVSDHGRITWTRVASKWEH